MQAKSLTLSWRRPWRSSWFTATIPCVVYEASQGTTLSRLTHRAARMASPGPQTSCHLVRHHVGLPNPSDDTGHRFS
jgi:hypothetical protein